MEVIDTVSMMNPQCKYGEDVMARITFHMTTPDGLQRMSDDIIEGLNELIDKAITNTYPPKKKKKKKKGEKGPVEYIEVPEEGKTYLRLTRDDIEDITIGFNTAMHHILLNLNPEFVGLAPFPPVIHHSMDIKARDLGININPSSYMFVLPIEAGFVGADNVGVLLAEEPYKHEENQLIIDIGTNGELVLGNRHKLISSSCATGPALGGRPAGLWHAGGTGRHRTDRNRSGDQGGRLQSHRPGCLAKILRAQGDESQRYLRIGYPGRAGRTVPLGCHHEERCFQQKGTEGSPPFPQKSGYQPAGICAGLGRRIQHRQRYRHYPERRPADSAGQGRPVCGLQTHGETDGAGKGRHGQDCRRFRDPCGSGESIDHGPVSRTARSR